MSNRETLEVDVLFVGAGVACLSGALHLANLITGDRERGARGPGPRKLDGITVAVLEKGAYVGSHNISGAIMDPGPLAELVPDYLGKGAPLECEVTKESACFLTRNRCIKSPVLPPPLNNHGNYVVSLSRLTGWLGDLVEQTEVCDIFPGFAATEVLYEGDRVVGVRTGDKGIDPEGGRKGNYEPGIDLRAKVTVFGEGSRGSLAKTVKQRFGLLAGKNPQSYVIGVKEVWEIPAGRVRPGEAIHTVGYPLKNDTYGGGFVYCMEDNLVSIGLLTGLDYRDPYLDPHREFQRFKTHPFLARMLEGGQVVQYGARTVPMGGYFAVPKLAFEGGVLVGDSAGLYNSQKIKGIHAAMKSGILAAEAIANCLRLNDYSEGLLAEYQRSLLESDVGKDLYRIRHFHRAFHKGLWRGLIKGGLQYLAGGRSLKGRPAVEPDHTHLRRAAKPYDTAPPGDAQRDDVKFDGKLTFDKETGVYYSATTHEEQQPPHLKIKDLNVCYGECTETYQNPCLRFCPAGVYEMEQDEETGKRNLKLNFSNCVHCKTCDIKDPYEIITWVPPEGGGGPKYRVM